VEHEQGYNPTFTPRGKRIDNYDSSIKYDNKAYRVFASKDHNDGRLLKCKKVTDTLTGYLPDLPDKKDKFGNTPDHCFIENGDIRGMKIPDKLDRQYYIDLSYKRLKDFGL
jgi:DNA polymerase